MLDLESVVSQQMDLPSAPAVIHQLTTLMKQDDVSSHEIARIVETDQAFAARTLKLVNSPFYGFARQITSVEQAITMLGVNSLQQLLLATSVMGALGTESSALLMDEFWMHSFSVGVVTKHLLPAENADSRNEAFMCGVLHDIGRLLLVKMDTSKYVRFYDDGKSVIDLEKENQWFGADHQQMGQALARKWNLPGSFATVTAYHHHPEKAQDYQLLVAAVHIADIICHALCLGRSGNDYISYFSPAAWHRLGLYSEHLETSVRQALDEIRETESTIRDIK